MVLRRSAASPRARALRLLWQASAPLSLLAVVFVVAEGALPVLVLVLMGRVTAAIPYAVVFGLSSAAGTHLLVALAWAGAVYAVSLMRGPLEDALTAAATARVDASMQLSLVRAVCAPVGVEHLEDEAVLDQIASARGELLAGAPAGAPMSLVSLLGDRLTGVLACVVLATFRWWLGLGMLVMWLAVRRPLAALSRDRATVARRAGPALRRSWYLLGLAWKPRAAKEVRVFDLGDWLAERHRDEWLEGMTPAWAKLRRLNRQVWLVGLVVLGAYLVAAGVLGWSAYHREISLRTLATMLPMLPTTVAVGSMSLADIQLEQLLTALPDLDALVARLASAPDVRDDGRRSARGLPARGVRFEGVGFAYPGGPPVLRSLDLSLSMGESLGLVGVNGAGKTTLITLLAHMRDCGSGRITVDGVPLASVTAREWQRQVAVVYQDFTRFPWSAARNVGAWGGGAPSPDLLAAAAERAGAAGLVASLPRGWDTVLSPHYAGGVDLSGGQWQRIALARAVYAVLAGARVLVLDEPTAQLDIRGEAAFYDRFLELTAGVTSIVVSHRFASVRRAHRIAVLDGGRISELGSHEQLLATGGTYARMFGVQAERFAAPDSDAGAAA